MCLFGFQWKAAGFFQMETPLIPDSDGEFCWELDVELELRLEERHVFMVVWKLQLGLDSEKVLHFLPFIIE